MQFDANGLMEGGVSSRSATRRMTMARDGAFTRTPVTIESIHEIRLLEVETKITPSPGDEFVRGRPEMTTQFGI